MTRETTEANEAEALYWLPKEALECLGRLLEQDAESELALDERTTRAREHARVVQVGFTALTEQPGRACGSDPQPRHETP